MKLFLAACLLGVVAAGPLPGEPTDGLLTVVSMIKGIVSTDYGFNKVKTYLLGLKSQDPVALGIRATIHQHSDEELKDVLNAFFAEIPILAIEPGFDYPTLETLFGEVKHVLKTDAGVAVVRTYMEVLNTPNEILQGIIAKLLALDETELKHFFDVLFSHLPEVSDVGYADYNIQEDIDRTAEQLKAIMITSAGIQQVRDHLKGLQSTDPTLILVKTVLSAMSDSSLIDLVKELGKDIKDVPIAEPRPDLLALVIKGKDLIITTEGMKFGREYLKNLKTGNFLIIRLKSFVDNLSDEELRAAVIKGSADIFGQFYVLQSAPYVADLRSLFVQIKHNLKSRKGFQDLKDYLTNLKATNMYVKIGKAYFLQMSEDQMRKVLNEFLKNFHDIEIEEGFDYPDLGQLFGQVKTSILTSDGLQRLREYAANLESDNYIVQRLQGALLMVDDSTLTDILADLFQGV